LPEAQRPRGAELQIAFGIPLSVRLGDLARRERTLLTLVVLAIYVAAMSRWCRQRDLIVAMVEYGRFRQELESMVGWLINHLHLRIQGSESDSFRDLLSRVTHEFHVACEHADFNRVPALMPECSTELLFNWQPRSSSMRSAADGEFAADGLKVQWFPISKKTPAARFMTFFSDTAAGITTKVIYRTDLFLASTIERFGDTLRLFAEEFTQRPHARVASISIDSARSADETIVSKGIHTR
jgi:non-ribosomal peptide synthetase component F